MGRLLDAYDRLQAQPFGTWSARNNNPGLQQMNSQRSDLTKALRTGIRNARDKGDAATVLKYQEAGNSMGLQTSGIRSYEQRQAGDLAFERDTRTKTGVNRDLADRALNGVDKIGASGQRDTVNPNATPVGGDQEDTANPNATPTGGDRFVSRINSSPMSFADQEAAKREEGALAGNFGSAAKGRARRQGAADLLDEAFGAAVEYEIGTDPETGGVAALPKIDDKKVSGFVGRALELGGTADSFRDALRRKVNSTGGVRGYAGEKPKSNGGRLNQL